MSTFFFSHDAFNDHYTGVNHPERAERVQFILKSIENISSNNLKRLNAPRASLSQIGYVHSEEYISKIFSLVPESGLTYLDADTVISRSSWEAALRAVGGACAGVDAVLEAKATNSFCAIRPPGHHAEPSRGMGFCLFNNIAIAAMHAKKNHGIKRVCIVDFDVHHGNGTQAAIDQHQDILYASSHQYPAYPGSGDEHDCGSLNNVINVPLRPGTGSELFREAYEKKIFPSLRKWSPELLLISAGFDAHFRDPLAELQLTSEDFSWVTKKLLNIAHEFCGNRVVVILEGGYDLEALSVCVNQMIRDLLAVADGAVPA